MRSLFRALTPYRAPLTDPAVFRELNERLAAIQAQIDDDTTARAEIHEKVDALTCVLALTRIEGKLDRVLASLGRPVQ